MHTDRYIQLCELICAIHGLSPKWRNCLLAMIYMNMEQKKAVISICRSQHKPIHSSLAYAKLSSNLTRNEIDDYYSLCSNSLLSGLLYAFVRFSPVDIHQITETRIKSIYKEIQVMCKCPRPNEIQFSRVFDKNDCEQMHDDIPFNLTNRQLIVQRLENWKRLLLTTVYYPKISSKSCSMSTVREAVVYGHIEDIDYRLTYQDIELIYHRTGMKLGGECEMRQKWYPSGLSPRTYYAMGGIAYHKSKNLQQVFNMLCDMLDPCSKDLCTQTNRLELNDNDYAFIYDLSSFTSNLHEQKSFIIELASYCIGVRIKVCDSWNGLQLLNLTDLLMEYSELFNGIVVCLEKMKDIYTTEYLEISQDVASLLGIYGNITSARFLHTMVMLQLTDNERQLNTAGDDGAIVTDNDDDPYYAILTMGEMERSKVYNSNERGSICLKRPIMQLGNRIRVGSLIIWPTFEYPRELEQVDLRYPHIRKQTKNERSNATTSSILGFLKQLVDMVIDKHEKLLIHNYLKRIYCAHGFNEGGNVPQISGNQPFVCCIQGEYIGAEPLKYTISMNYNGLAKIPLRGYLPFKKEYLMLKEFKCNGNKRLSHLAKLGYIMNKKEYVIYFGEEGLDRLLKEFFTTEMHINVYTVIENIPQLLLF